MQEMNPTIPVLNFLKCHRPWTQDFLWFAKINVFVIVLYSRRLVIRKESLSQTGPELLFSVLWGLELVYWEGALIWCRSHAKQKHGRAAHGIDLKVQGGLLSPCPGEVHRRAVLGLRTRIHINPTQSWEQTPPAANSKHLGLVVTQTVREAYLFLVWPLSPTRALLVHDLSGKDDFIIQRAIW